ncbi:MAG: hypothetical protein GY821_13410 [Gammaproteobacteria bacterium]|nr:hypothetical protein [Gammaproteobacteria bacterium]
MSGTISSQQFIKILRNNEQLPSNKQKPHTGCLSLSEKWALNRLNGEIRQAERRKKLKPLPIKVSIVSNNKKSADDDEDRGTTGSSIGTTSPLLNALSQKSNSLDTDTRKLEKRESCPTDPLLLAPHDDSEEKLMWEFYAYYAERLELESVRNGTIAEEKHKKLLNRYDVQVPVAANDNTTSDNEILLPNTDQKPVLQEKPLLIRKIDTELKKKERALKVKGYHLDSMCSDPSH